MANASGYATGNFGEGAPWKNRGALGAFGI